MGESNWERRQAMMNQRLWGLVFLPIVYVVLASFLMFIGWMIGDWTGVYVVTAIMGSMSIFILCAAVIKWLQSSTYHHTINVVEATVNAIVTNGTSGQQMEMLKKVIESRSTGLHDSQQMALAIHRQANRFANERAVLSDNNKEKYDGFYFEDVELDEQDANVG